MKSLNELMMEQRVAAFEMRERGLNEYEIGRALEISRSRVRNWFRLADEGPKSRSVPRPRSYGTDPDTSRPLVTPEALADRDYRLSLAPRDLTAAFCGDPLPGYSALERGRP